MIKRLGILCVLLLTFVTIAWGGGVITITASDNAYVLSGGGDQSETSSLTVRSTAQLAYLRFNISGLTVTTNDLVYLDLHCTFQSTKHPQKLLVAALNDGTVGAATTETSWDSTLTYANRPDGTSGPLNGNTTAVVTYKGRVMQATAGSGGPRNQENPPGQIAIVIANSVFRTLTADDTNGELTLILYGPYGYINVASLGSGKFEPQLRIVRKESVETIPESIYGGQLHKTADWNDTGTTSAVGEEPYNQFLLFELPKQPGGGFKAEDTTLEIKMASNGINPGNWGLAMVDIWGIGYVPSSEVPLVLNDVKGYLLQGDTETKAGWNLGGDLTEKIYNNLASPYSSSVRYGIPPEGCTSLTDFINDLFANHGVDDGDYLVLRVVPDCGPDNGQKYTFNTGNAAANLKPVLTLSSLPQGMVLVFR